MKYRFLKQPVYCQKEIYETAAQKIADYAAGFSEVLAVYKMGNVSVPGISDLDMIVVLGDEATIPDFAFPTILNTVEKYTLMHSVFVVTETFWRNRQLYYVYDNLHHLRGEKKLTAENFDEKLLKHLATRFAIQHILRAYASVFAQLTSGYLKVRSTLCELHALRYDIPALETFLEEEHRAEFASVAGDIAHLRKTWFETETELAAKKFLEICDVTKRFLRKTIIALNRSFTEGKHLNGSPVALPKIAISKSREIYFEADKAMEISGASSRLARAASRLPLPAKMHLKINNNLGYYQLILPLSIYDFMCDSDTPVLNQYTTIMKRRQEILLSPGMQQIRKKGYAVPLLDFQI